MPQFPLIRFARFAFLFWSFLGMGISFLLGASQSDSSPLPLPEEFLQPYRTRIERLAAQCDQKQMTLEASVTRARLYLPGNLERILPRWGATVVTSLPSDADANQKEWFAQLQAIQREESEKLFQQALEYAHKGEGYGAFLLADWALSIDQNNADARKVFGYEAREGEWLTSFQVGQQEKGLTYDPKRGWIDPKKDPAGKKKNWQLETDHFKIKTTVSQETAAEAGELLEAFYQYWFRSYPWMSMTNKEAASFVLGRYSVKRKNFPVVIYKDRRDYLAAATKLDKDAVISSGGYLPTKGVIYLYPPEQEGDTPLGELLCHEATHLLFSESPLGRKSSPPHRLNAGLKANYWALEGIAVYLETFEILRDRFRTGGAQSPRFQRAQERTEEYNGLIPIGDFVALGRDLFQQGENLPARYTEAAGLAYFLYFAQEGRYADVFHQILEQVYRGDDQPDDLQRLTGLNDAALDRAFRSFLKEPVPSTKENP